MRWRLVFRWLGFVLLVAMALLGTAVFALHRWVAGDDFRGRVEQQASALLGAPLSLGRLTVDVWPPAVAADGVRVATAEPLTVQRLELRPDWRAALAGEPALATLVARGAVLPEKGVDALLAGLRRLARPDTGGARAPGRENPRWLPRRLVLDDVTWVRDTGARSTLVAEAAIAPDGLPATASARVTAGRYAGLQVELAPGQGSARWQLRARLGGGTAEGPVRLALPDPDAPAPGAPLSLEGELAVRDVDVAFITQPSHPLSGRLVADTRYAARGAGWGALADNLQSSTRFSVQGARLEKLDLLRAVQTVGLSRGGQTDLQELTGDVSTRGRSAQVRNLVARSGPLTARGEVNIAASRALSGRVSVDLAAGATRGAVGVPLVVGGTLDAPEVTLTRGAMLGAALGTVVLPGVGTGAGAKLGDRLEGGLKGLFGR